MRCSLYASIKNEYKYSSALELLGCTIEEFKKYIASQFQQVMSWENWGKRLDKWNLDHIVPIAFFDLTQLDEQIECFHYTNLQPLCEIENLLKSDFICTNVRGRKFKNSPLQQKREIIC